MTEQGAMSLQRRLLILLVSTVTVVWLSAAWFMVWNAGHEIDELLDGHLAQAAALLVVQQTHVDNDDDTGVEVPNLHKYAPLVAFQVFHSGVLVMASPNVGRDPMSSATRGFATVTLGAGESWRVFAARGDHRDVQVYVGERTRSRSEIVMTLLRGMVLPLLVALPVLAGLVWSSVHVGLAPLRRLGLLLRQRKPQAVEPLPTQGQPAEMQPLVMELNGLLERVGHHIESERRFTADAAHELRTPIAAIRAQAEVALGAGDDTRQRTLALKTTLAGCDRAARLVDQLLTLARLEARDLGDTAPVQTSVELGPLAQSVAAHLAPLAIARGQDLELDAQPGCTVRGPEGLIAVLVRNLVDNALRYTPAGGLVRVNVTDQDGQVCLRVQDSGPGLGEADLRRLGERFFRALGQSEPGSGLGWSIVRRIAQVTDATVTVQASTTYGGLDVSVSWPTSDPSISCSPTAS